MAIVGMNVFTWAQHSRDVALNVLGALMLGNFAALTWKLATWADKEIERRKQRE